MSQFEPPPLRGSGSQSYSQNNGERVGTTSTTYSSGSTGQIQGDATRPYESLFHGVESWGGSLSSAQNTIFDLMNSISSVAFNGWYAGSAFEESSSPEGSMEFTNGSTNYFQDMFGWYTYELNYSTSTDEDGNEHIDSIELVPTWHDNTTIKNRRWFVYLSNEMTSPTSTEIRPINIAVRYFIRAR